MDEKNPNKFSFGNLRMPHSQPRNTAKSFITTDADHTRLSTAAHTRIITLPVL